MITLLCFANDVCQDKDEVPWDQSKTGWRRRDGVTQLNKTSPISLRAFIFFISFPTSRSELFFYSQIFIQDANPLVYYISCLRECQKNFHKMNLIINRFNNESFDICSRYRRNLIIFWMYFTKNGARVRWLKMTISSIVF